MRPGCEREAGLSHRPLSPSPTTRWRRTRCWCARPATGSPRCWPIGLHKLLDMTRTRVLIAGAAGRDFHNFNLVYRGREEFEVVAFTATQIPNIEGRVYPAALAGELYPNGIPIVAEDELEAVIARREAEQVVFAYSDVTHEHVMHLGSRALAAGASYLLLSPRETMLTSSKPVVAVCAVRTGAGKSQTTRYVAELLRGACKRVAVLRHPMPYGDLAAQAVQRFE